jgi:hypothetical protein
MSYMTNGVSTDSMGGEPRFFYGLRRTDDGTLYFVRSDTLLGSDTVQINAPGDINNDFIDFSSGADFFEGRDVYHNIVYPNLNYEQMRWDNRSIYYYVNSNGELVARIGAAYSYTQPDNL